LRRHSDWQQGGGLLLGSDGDDDAYDSSPEAEEARLLQAEPDDTAACGAAAAPARKHTLGWYRQRRGWPPWDVGGAGLAWAWDRPWTEATTCWA